MICIYKATNKIDGKIYIGRTNNLHRRMIEHKHHASKDGGAFHAAILQDGFDNFIFEVIEECQEDELDEKEIAYIQWYREHYGEENIYNYCKGGLGGGTHDVSGENNPMYGRPVSEERKKLYSQLFKGKKKPKEFGAKISAKLKGVPKSPEAVAKKSHPIQVINIHTNQIKTFPSKSAMERELHTCTSVIVNGGTTKGGWKLYIPEV